MSNKAYILGINRKGLEFAEKDADSIKQILSRSGYHANRLKADKASIQTALDEMVDNSGPNDRVIFYYSGHGLLDDGILHLLLDEDSERQSNKLSITTIYENLTKCRAQWKLLILDCCHAKAEPQEWAARRSEKFLVLTASKRLESAKEFENLQAGFLTYHLCQALEKPTEDMLDKDRTLRINAVYDYLQEQARIYRSQADSTEVSMPDLTGDRSYDFPLINFSDKAQALIPPLHLPDKRWKVGSGMAESQLLRAEEAQVPFDLACQSELQEVEDWLDSPEFPQTVRLIIGAGGLGKTRLALELCRKRFSDDWQAGFLNRECSTESMAKDWQNLRDAKQPLLIVIDYAETRQEILLALVRAMLKNPAKEPVRVLLLARNGGEWWDNLPGMDADCEPLLSGYATSGPFRLPPLYLAVEDRSTAYQEAVQAFTKTLKMTPPDLVPDLSGEHFGRPLYLQMAALLALHDERPTTAEGLTTALLNHERRYWKGSLANSNLTTPEYRAQKLLALATLAGGFTSPDQAHSYWMAANGSMGKAEELEILFDSLMPLYPEKQGLQAVRPDLLGEALVGVALRRSDANRLLDAVLSHDIDKTVRYHALTILARLSDQRENLHETLIEALSRHFVHCYREILQVAVETGGDLSRLAEAAFNRLSSAAKSQLAGLLEPLLREESVQLASLACAVSGFLTEKAHRKLAKKKNNAKLIADYAIRLMNYSIGLERAGHNEKVKKPAQNSLKLLKQLYDKNQQAYAPAYAASLNNISRHLSSVGQYNEALNHTDQALEIHQRLAKKNPDCYDPDYAMSLNNFSIRLSDAGCYNEALNRAEQALGIYQQLALKKPDYYEPDYAMSLNNFSIRLSDAGKCEEALDWAGQALEIYQRLVRKNPDRYEPDHAMSLSNISNRLSDAGKCEEALNWAGQALEIRQRLVRKNPDRYEQDYVSSLNNVSNRLSDVGRYEEALSCAEQALELYQRLANKSPDRYKPNYAMALNNIGMELSNMGRYEEAISHAKQASEIRQRLAAKYPERYASDSFSSTCEVFFLAWLLSPSSTERELKQLHDVPITDLPHRDSELQFYKNFILGCCADEQSVRSERFAKAITSWNDLSSADKISNRTYWFCVAAWCATFAPETIADTDWQASWKQFKEQRQGRIPAWMERTAENLSFQWPG